MCDDQTALSQSIQILLSYKEIILNKKLHSPALFEYISLLGILLRSGMQKREICGTKKLLFDDFDYVTSIFSVNF